MFHKYNTHKESCGFTIYSIMTGNFVSIPMPKLTSEFSYWTLYFWHIVPLQKMTKMTRKKQEFGLAIKKLFRTPILHPSLVNGHGLNTQLRFSTPASDKANPGRQQVDVSGSGFLTPTQQPMVEFPVVISIPSPNPAAVLTEVWSNTQGHSFFSPLLWRSLN